MATLQEIRQQYPQYKDMPDNVLADKLYQKFYSDIPREQFDAQLGLSAKPPSTKWYGEEPGIAAKLLQGAGSIATGVSDVMSGRVDPKSEQGIANITNAAAVATPVSAASRGGLGWAGVARSPKLPVKTPVGKELLETGDFGYNMAREMDVRFKPEAVKNMALRLQSQLFKAGFRDRENSAPETFGELKGILKSGDESGAFVSIDDLHAVKLTLQNAAKNFNKPTDQRAAIKVIKEIDKFISVPDPKSVVAGDAASAGAIWKEATANTAAGKRDARLAGLEDDAELQAIATNSGLNADNKLRQMAALIVRKPQLRAGFSGEEIAKLRNVVGEGAKARNALRWFAHYLGGGGGLGAFLTGAGSTFYTGFSAPAIVGTAVVGTGLTAKVLANKITKNKLAKVAETVRQRSPLYQERLANAPAAPPPLMNPGARSMMGRSVTAAPMAGPETLFKQMEEQQITPQMYDEYLRQKYARDQGA